MTIAVDHIVDALHSLGGEAHLDAIVQRVSVIAPAPLPRDVGASVRARMQERCKEARSFKGGEILFESVHGVDARKGVWRLVNEDPLNITQPDGFQDGADAFIEDEEGKATLRIHLRRERSKKLVQAFKANLIACRCCVCDFDFEAAYGELGLGYIEAHHTIPISHLVEGAKTKITDLVPVCANCHRMLHRNKLLDWRVLKARVAEQRKRDAVAA